MNFTILRYDSLDSTNTEAAKQAKLGADEGLCVIAARQTAGRGRHGRTWVSGKDAGLYCSVVLRPKIGMRFLPLITLMAGVAVYDTLKEFGLDPDIKWVNDILVGDKKISGILAETVETPTGLAVVVGIGINLTSANFPDEIAATATSIEAELRRQRMSEPGTTVTGAFDRAGIELAEVETVLTKYLNYWYSILSDDNGNTEILNGWRQRSTYFTGKSVRVTLDGSSFDGTTDGLQENGALRVKTVDGSVRIVQTGDVQRLRSRNRER